MKESEFWKKNTRYVLLLAFLLVILFMAMDVFYYFYPNLFVLILTFEYFTEFMAATVGVFLALALGQRILAVNSEKRVSAIKGILLKELNRMHYLASAGKANYLETQVWKSLINSGDVALLPVGLQDELFDLYSGIQPHNLEAKIVRNAKEEMDRTPKGDVKTEMMIAHSRLVERFKPKEVELAEKIQRVIDSDKWYL